MLKGHKCHANAQLWQSITCIYEQNDQSINQSKGVIKPFQKAILAFYILTLKIDDELSLLYYNPFSQETCTVRVDTTDTRVFVENATGVIAVTIQDYTRKLLVLKEEDYIKLPYVHVISAVTVQVKHIHRTNVSWKDIVLNSKSS